MMKKAVILLSGGIDSTTCLALAKKDKFQCYALSFNYGQKSQAEIFAAKKIAKNNQVIKHKIVNLQDLGSFGGSAITDNNIELKTSNHSDDIPSSYVPGRNTVFLSIALSWAEAISAEAIYIGAHKDDYDNYPDCRAEFIESFQNMANLSNRKAIEGKPITIMSPLINLKKSAIISMGTKLGVDYTDTVTCYQITEDNVACGKCLSCTTRKESFANAGIIDPANYQCKIAT